MNQTTIPITMSTTDMRAEVATWLNDLDDNFLAAVHAMVGTYVAKREEVAEPKDEVIGYKVGTQEPILASEADDAFEAIVEDVKKGNYVEVDDLIAQPSARW